jgi:hypothetical protein
LVARRSSLGPFPKSHRLVEIAARHGLSPGESNRLIEEVRTRVAQLIDDTQALDSVTFFAALPIVTRFSDPETQLHRLFTISFHENLQATLDRLLTVDSAVSRAALSTISRFTSTARFEQAAILEDPWIVWRGLDGSGFCDLGRQFFACLTEEHLAYYLRCHTGSPIDSSSLRQHAWELSLITRSFSARWFNKCAAGQIPDRGNIRWYLGHCLGKLDMELERELTTHVEPLPNPFRRRRQVEPPSLGLGI